MEEGYVHIDSCVLRRQNGAPDPLHLDFQVVAVWFPPPKDPARWGSTQSLTSLPSLSTHIHTTIRTTAVNSWIGTFRRQREVDFMWTCGISTPAWRTISHCWPEALQPFLRRDSFEALNSILIFLKQNSSYLKKFYKNVKCVFTNCRKLSK